MVCTCEPSACNASIVQDLIALPSTCTTQQPHCEVSQPTWVPVRRSSSRSNCTKSVRGSTLALTALPFTVSETAGMATPSFPDRTIYAADKHVGEEKARYAQSRNGARFPSNDSNVHRGTRQGQVSHGATRCHQPCGGRLPLVVALLSVARR